MKSPIVMDHGIPVRAEPPWSLVKSRRAVDDGKHLPPIPLGSWHVWLESVVTDEWVFGIIRADGSWIGARLKVAPAFGGEEKRKWLERIEPLGHL